MPTANSAIAPSSACLKGACDLISGKVLVEISFRRA